MGYGLSLLDAARSAMSIADVDSNLGIEIVSQFCFDRYVELVGRTRLRQIRRVGNLSYPQPLTSGTVTSTLGSNLVVGNTSGPNQTFFSRGQVSWFFRTATNWYQVVDVDPAAQTLTLQVPYAESTNTNAYALVSRYLKLDKDVRWIGSIVHQRLFRKLSEKTLDWLDARHPARIVVGAIPTFWAEGPHYRGEQAGFSDERKQVEIYPSSTQLEMFQYTYWAIPATMDPTDTLPPEIDRYAIREGALVDIYRRAQLELARKGSQADLSGLIRDQQMRWEKAIQQMHFADKGQEDDSVELWSGYDMGTEADIPSEKDIYSSIVSGGLVTVQ